MRLLRAALCALAVAAPLALPSAARADETPAAAASGTKIAIVDFRRAVLDTEDGLRVQSNLKKLYDQQATDFAAKKKAIEEEKEKLEKEFSAPNANKAALEKKAEAWTKKARELEQTQQQLVLNYQKAEQEQTAPILKKVQDIIQRLALADGYDVILDKAVAHYVKRNLDLTDKVIQTYNAGVAADPKKDPKKDPPKADPPKADPPKKK